MNFIGTSSVPSGVRKRAATRVTGRGDASLLEVQVFGGGESGEGVRASREDDSNEIEGLTPSAAGSRIAAQGIAGAFAQNAARMQPAGSGFRC